MHTHAYLGTNIGKLPFNFYATLRIFGNYGVNKNEIAIEHLFKHIEPIVQLHYSIEKGNDKSYYHSHLLINAPENRDVLYESLNAYIMPKKTKNDKRIAIAKLPKNYLLKNGEVPFQDEYFNLDSTKFTNNKMELYLEPIISSCNASIYSTKFNSYGLNNGYFQR